VLPIEIEGAAVDGRARRRNGRLAPEPKVRLPPFTVVPPVVGVVEAHQPEVAAAHP